MNSDARLFFDSMPEAFPIYEAFEEKVTASFPLVRVQVRKSQISFSNRHLFACVSLRKIKNQPGFYIIVTFGLSYQVESRRIFQSVEPYPNRWTHHVLVRSADELDDELMGWIRQAYDFSAQK